MTTVEYPIHVPLPSLPIAEKEVSYLRRNTDAKRAEIVAKVRAAAAESGDVIKRYVTVTNGAMASRWTRLSEERSQILTKLLLAAFLGFAILAIGYCASYIPATNGRALAIAILALCLLFLVVFSLALLLEFAFGSHTKSMRLESVAKMGGHIWGIGTKAAYISDYYGNVVPVYYDAMAQAKLDADETGIVLTLRNGTHVYQLQNVEAVHAAKQELQSLIDQAVSGRA